MPQKKLDALIDILHGIIPLQDLDRLLVNIVDAAKTVVNADYAAIIHSANGSRFDVIADSPLAFRPVDFNFDTIKRAFVEPCSETEVITGGECGSDRGPCVAVPLILPRRGDRYGAVYLEKHDESSTFSNSDLGLIIGFTNLMAIAIENTILYTNVIHDELTSAYARNYFVQRLNEEFARSKRLDSHLGLLMIDVDNFKSINDAYGHFTGDQILIQLVDLVKNNIRNYDVYARIGGDEFGLLLPGLRQQAVFKVATKLQENIEKATWPEGLPISCSMGGATSPTSRATDSIEFMRQADTALYQAKHGGRSQAIIAGRKTPIVMGKVKSDYSEREALVKNLKVENEKLIRKLEIHPSDQPLTDELKSSIHELLRMAGEILDS